MPGRQAGIAPGRGAALTPSDHGRPVPVARLDRKYRRGGFRFLDSLEELGHYLIVAGYIRRLFASPAILDVGCGDGRLAELLDGCRVARYRGIDLSAEAIRRARERGIPHMTFEVADLNTWEPPEQYDVIVFCESLSYAAHPAHTLHRYARALAPAGAFVVSLYRHRAPGALWRQTWRNAGRFFETVDAMTVANRQGQVWDVKVLREPAGGREDH